MGKGNGLSFGSNIIEKMRRSNRTVAKGVPSTKATHGSIIIAISIHS